MRICRVVLVHGLNTRVVGLLEEHHAMHYAANLESEAFRSAVVRNIAGAKRANDSTKYAELVSFLDALKHGTVLVLYR